MVVQLTNRVYPQDDRHIVAIIPARGGSKGIPKKNLADLCGKPLIAYAIEPAVKSGVFARVIVSTDDAEIAEVAQDYGAQVPFLRPPELATDKASLGEVISYTCEQIRLRERIKIWAVAQIIPSYPFRTSEDLRLMVELLMQGYYAVDMRRFETIIPGNFCPYPVQDSRGLFNLGAKGYVQCWRVVINTTMIRNSLGPDDPTLRLIKQRFGRNLVAYVKADEFRALDIDTPEDLEVAREAISGGWFDPEEAEPCKEWVSGYETELPL
jgi:CMP-N-acetylneuraminic acid synthetase